MGNAASVIGAEVSQPAVVDDRMWIIVLVACFLGVFADGMDLILVSLSLPSLMADFGMSKIQAGMLGTVLMIGQGIGGLFGGWFADRYGRVRVISWSIFIFAVGTALLGVCQEYWQLCVIRFIAALGIGAEWSISITLMSEYVPTNRRGAVLGIVSTGWTLGYITASGLAGAFLPVYGWRPLFLAMIFPVFLAMYIRRRIPEPPAWVAKKKEERASGQKTVFIQEWLNLFSNKRAVKYLVLWTIASFALAFGYYGINTWMPTYLASELGLDFRKMTTFMIATFASGLLGRLVIGFIADKWGRRLAYSLGTIVAAAGIPVVMHFHTADNIVFMLAALGFFYGMPYAVIGAYMTETFEVGIRGTAISGAYNVGRIGAATAPLMIGTVASAYSIGMGLTVLGAAYLLTGLVTILFIPPNVYDCDKK